MAADDATDAVFGSFTGATIREALSKRKANKIANKPRAGRVGMICLCYELGSGMTFEEAHKFIGCGRPAGGYPKKEPKLFIDTKSWVGAAVGLVAKYIKDKDDTGSEFDMPSVLRVLSGGYLPPAGRCRYVHRDAKLIPRAKEAPDLADV